MTRCPPPRKGQRGYQLQEIHQYRKHPFYGQPHSLDTSQVWNQHNFCLDRDYYVLFPQMSPVTVLHCTEGVLPETCLIIACFHLLQILSLRTSFDVTSQPVIPAEDHHHIYNKKPDMAIFVCSLMAHEEVFTFHLGPGEHMFTSQTVYSVRKIA